MKRISIVIPAYNEAPGIPSFIEAVMPVIASLPTYDFEIVFVNDGSTDDTLEKIKALSRERSWIKHISLTRNFGKEAALTAGLDFATGDAIIFMDADLQHPPQLIEQFLIHWEAGCMVVAGRRTSRETDARAYKIFAQAFYRLHNRISDIAIPENVGDFRLIDRKVADQLRALKEHCRFMKGLFAWVGYQPFYIEYDVAPRMHGRSTFNRWRSWNFALEGITSFSTVPLRIWSYLGALVLSIGLAYSLLIVGKAMVMGVSTPGYVTLLTAVVVFGGVQLIGIGILGEYVGRIYMEVKHRPPYLIDEISVDNKSEKSQE